VYISGLSATIMTQANFTRNIFLQNAANASTFGGAGALYLDGGINLLTNNTFQQNEATGYAGALAYTYECFDVDAPGNGSGCTMHVQTQTGPDCWHPLVTKSLVVESTFVFCVIRHVMLLLAS